MSHWTIRRQIQAGFVALVALMLGTAGLSLRELDRVHELSDAAQSCTQHNLIMVKRLADHLTWVQQLQLELLDMSPFQGQLDPRQCRFGKWYYDSQEQAGIVDPAIRKWLVEIEGPHNSLHSSGRRILELRRAGQEAASREAFTQTTGPALKTLEEKLGRIRERYRILTDERLAEVDRVAGVARGWVLATALGFALLALCGSLVLSKHIVSILERAVGDLAEAIGQTGLAARQISLSSQSLAEGASEQAAALEETSASSGEISSMARANAQASHASATLTAQSQHKFEEANESLGQMVEAMSEIDSSSGKISKIIKVIDEIAFQTNILALNAAVEAARAGQAGQGFSVVADEVRTLAQRSAQAARDTAELIEDSVARSRAGKTKVDTLARSLQGITAEVSQVKTLVEEAEAGSNQQVLGIEQIAKAIAEMEQLTQRVAATAQENASASEELTAQTKSIEEIAGRLQVLVG